MPQEAGNRKQETGNKQVGAWNKTGVMFDPFCS